MLKRKRSSVSLCEHLLAALSLVLALVLAGCAGTPKAAKDKPATADVAAQVQDALVQGDQAYRRGDTERAMFHYVTALNLDPDNTDLLYRVGTIHTEKKNLDAADQAFERILTLDPEHPGALEGHGLVLLRQRRYDVARQALEQSVRLDSGRWRALNGLGVISDIKNDHALAITYYELALEKRPGMPMVLNNLGYSYYLVGDWDAAEKAFNQAVTSDPKHRKTWSNLGMLYVRKEEYDRALQAFSRLMSKPEAYNTVGYVCMLEGKFERAEAFFMDAIRLSPSYYEAAHDNLARARARVSTGTGGSSAEEAVQGVDVDSATTSDALPLR